MIHFSQGKDTSSGVLQRSVLDPVLMKNICMFPDTEYLDDDQDAGIQIMFITFADDTK